MQIAINDQISRCTIKPYGRPNDYTSAMVWVKVYGKGNTYRALLVLPAALLSHPIMHNRVRYEVVA